MTEATAQGWRLLPEEPTQGIEDAIIEEIQRQGVAFDDFSEPLFPRALYRVIVAAAPSAPVPSERAVKAAADDLVRALVLVQEFAGGRLAMQPEGRLAAIKYHAGKAVARHRAKQPSAAANDVAFGGPFAHALCQIKGRCMADTIAARAAAHGEAPRLLQADAGEGGGGGGGTR